MSIHDDRILFEDDHLLIVDKLSGELVVKGSGKVQKLPLYDFLKKDHPGLTCIHRLDFETSGAVAFAKSAAVRDTILDSGFEGWRKTYRMLVMGRIGRKKGIIRKPLPARSGGKEVPAHTEYAVLERFANSSYVEAELVTGRYHQIRKHFASIKHPLAMDTVYGHKKFNQVFRQELGVKRFLLHAYALHFPHPETGERMTVSCPLPKPFERVLSMLRSF